MISIALASYNGEKYLREQLDSILSQTIQDFEVVVCDDASIDSTWSILEEYKEKDSRFRIYRNKENLGFKNNFEKAISLCKGDYIALSDQDDIWTQNHLEILKNLIGDNYLVCGNSEIIDGNGVNKGYDLKKLEALDYVSSNNLDLAYRIMLMGNPFQGACMMLSKKFRDIALPFPENINFHDTWFAALSTINNSFIYTTKIINAYRQHDENVTSLYKRSFYNLIKNTKLQSGSKNDRGFYITAIKKRVDMKNLTIETINFIEKVDWYYANIEVRSKRLVIAYFRFKNYSKIYSTKSKKLYLPRLIKFLIT